MTKGGRKVRVPLNGVVKQSAALSEATEWRDRDQNGVACEA